MPLWAIVARQIASFLTFYFCAIISAMKNFGDLPTGNFCGEIPTVGFIGQTPAGGFNGDTPVGGIIGDTPIGG
jgi:hypothetical protein